MIPVVRIKYFDFRENLLFFESQSINKQKNAFYDQVAMKIAEIGLAGWEMIGMANKGYPHVIYFKRKVI
jgi:hypothetical protein